MEKRRRERIGEDSPKAALRSEVRKFSARAVNAGGKQNKATPPTWLAAALVRHDRFFLRSTRRLRLREGSIVAQLFPPPLVSAPPEWGNTAAIISEETRTGRRCAREFRAHLSSFRRVAGRLCRENNQGDTADVARGPLGSPWSVFSRSLSRHPRRIIHGVSAKRAHRADFSSAPVRVLVGGHGDSS